MMMITRCLLVALAAILMTACGAETSHAESAQRTPAISAPATPPAPPAQTEAQTAAATLAEMLAAAEAGDWGTYVDGFYGETHKFRTPADRDSLVQRFQERWGEKVLVALREASTLTPTIEDGRAFFKKDDGQPAFILQKADDGRWTFHL